MDKWINVVPFIEIGYIRGKIDVFVFRGRGSVEKMIHSFGIC